MLEIKRKIIIIPDYFYVCFITLMYHFPKNQHNESIITTISVSYFAVSQIDEHFVFLKGLQLPLVQIFKS